MRLTKLEIKGFKSFARNTVINFSQSVTGIVGPNGSGKSNIVDAIRWVLGEQRTTGLRLEKMGDVLFNGTKKRKAANMASVSLTFLNDKGVLPSEYNEVTVTRTLLRSGHSEYKLNNVVCRLKDIQNLFVDTGISSNSYAIIELKMIDDILEDKDQSRRKMFEQAAGVSKYKKRKHETMLKLKSANEDLERVEDLLSEIRSNLKQLERQARRAKKYLKLKEQYRHLSIQLTLIKLQDLRNKHDALKEEIGKAQDHYRELSARLRTKEAALEEEKKKHLGKETELSTLQKGVNELLGKIRQLENDARLAEQEVEFARTSIGKEKEGIEKDREKQEDLRAEEKEIAESLGELEEEERNARQSLDEARQKKEKVERAHQTRSREQKSLLDTQMKFEKEIFSLEKEKALVENTAENAARELERMDRVAGELEEKMATSKKQLEEFEREYSKKEEFRKRLVKAVEQREEAEEELGKKLEKLRDEQARFARKMDALKNEYQLTKSMVDNLEGFPESIKFLSKSKGWQQKAHLFSDILHCSEQYRQALEALLEPYLNYYVVEDFQTAREGITQLKNAQKGRANFFVLGAFEKGRPTPERAGLISAREVVNVSPVYRKLMDWLLYKVYIAEDTAFAEIKEREEEATIISDDGHLMRRPRSLTGGSLGLFDGKKLGRRKNLEKLQTEIKQLEIKLEDLTAEKIELKRQQEKLASEDVSGQLVQLRQELERINVNKSRVEAQWEEMTERSRRRAQRQEDLRRSVEENKGKAEKIAARLAEMKAEYEERKSEIQSSSSRVEQISEALSDVSSEYNERQLELMSKQNRLQSARQELDYIGRQQEEIASRIEERENQIKRLEASMVKNREDIERWTEKRMGLLEEKQQMEGKLSDSEQAYFSARNVINAIEKEIQGLNQSQRQYQAMINEQKDEFNDVKMQMNSATQRIRVEFNMQEGELAEIERDEEVAEEGLEEKVEKLREKLFRFGEVNPLAVDAYKEMEERYNGIVEQRDDILEAQASLEQTIAELEQTATRRFMEAFDRVRENFIDIFQKLFTEGDRCDLILLNEEDPLESGIEIIAKPKGKRPLSLSQLSGGEKTLTATALLFALYLLKPAPFCVFDEVDAPLDDANIQKFNRIVKSFSKDSQFVIITHNKLTMAAVDVIYGIYMDEPGVSAVTPVDFRKFQHEALPVELVEN